MTTENKSVLKKRLAALGLSGAALLGASFLIAPEEGLVLNTYKDSVGIVTACRGHTGSELKLGQTFTLEQCDKQYVEDVKRHDKEMLKHVKVEFISPYQHSALLSFCYNVGVPTCSKSTLFRKLNEGDHIASCKELTKWVFAQGKDCRLKQNNCGGIVTRRTKEMRWCLGDLTEQERKEISQDK